MFRVGIIGSENSHAMGFSRIFNLSGKYDDIRVVAIYGEDEAATQKIHDECGVEMMTPAEMLGKVDAIMVTSRNGKFHAPYARPFIEAGIPAFLDKPIANCGREAEEIVALAREKGVPVMGGSGVKMVADALALKEIAEAAKAEGKLLGGHIYAPVSLTNEYGGFYFYSAHLAETALTIFGYDPIAVQAVRKDNGVAGVIEYADFSITFSFTEGAWSYGATVLAKNGATHRNININGFTDTEAAHFVHMLRTGEVPQCDHDIVYPIKVLNAIEKAYLTGTRQLIV